MSTSKSCNVPGNSFHMSKNPDMGKKRKYEENKIKVFGPHSYQLGWAIYIYIYIYHGLPVASLAGEHEDADGDKQDKDPDDQDGEHAESWIFCMGLHGFVLTYMELCVCVYIYIYIYIYIYRCFQPTCSTFSKNIDFSTCQH